MGVDTVLPIVALSVGTPNCFVLVDVEGGVSFVPFDEFDFDFLVVVCVAAVTFVLAVVHGDLLVVLTEFGSEPVGVVDLFDLVVREGAIITALAIGFGALVVPVVELAEISSAVCVVVVIGAVVFLVAGVGFLERTGYGFERIEVDVLGIEAGWLMRVVRVVDAVGGIGIIVIAVGVVGIGVVRV